jgi:uncharacterized protein involved in exopolysaccharide biosynthesis
MNKKKLIWIGAVILAIVFLATLTSALFFPSYKAESHVTIDP